MKIKFGFDWNTGISIFPAVTIFCYWYQKECRIYFSFLKFDFWIELDWNRIKK